MKLYSFEKSLIMIKKINNDSSQLRRVVAPGEGRKGSDWKPGTPNRCKAGFRVRPALVFP